MQLKQFLVEMYSFKNYIREEKRSQVNYLNFYINKLEKEK